MPAGAITASAPYLIPFDGLLSAPLAPLSISDLGVTFGNTVGVSTSLTRYAFDGLGLRGDLDGHGAVVGPFLAPFIAPAGSLSFAVGSVALSLSAGYFVLYPLRLQPLHGPFAAIIREQESAALAAPELTAERSFGYGEHAGARIEVPITGGVAAVVRATFLSGVIPRRLSDSYFVADQCDVIGAAAALPAYSSDISPSVTGVELSVGVRLSG